MLKQKKTPLRPQDSLIIPSKAHTKFPAIAAKSPASKRLLSVTALVAITVWLAWLVLAGPGYALSNLIANWEAATTMILGSMVAGGTSLGGGAVAFPVFTKVLQVPPDDAKVFSLAIQSIGMSAASLAIVAMKTNVEWRFIRWASLGGVPGILLGSVWLAPLLPANAIKLSFTMMICSFGVVLFALKCAKSSRKLAIPVFGQRERMFSLAAGLWGGVVSGLVGSGMDIVGFSIMVLLFGVSEKVSTPTSVILMAINAVVGFGLHLFFIGDFVAPITNYWLAAVPVVVVGAPAGAILCSLMKPKTITRLLASLILIELVSSLLLVPLDAVLLGYSCLVFAAFSLVYYGMCKSKIYTEHRFTNGRS